MPPKVKIDYARAVELAKEQIALKGDDYIYEVPGSQCVNTVEYSDGDIQPSCIVGCILVAAGVDVRVLHDQASTSAVSDAIYALGRDTEIEATRKAEYFLEGLQARQDCGVPWGTAFNLAVDDVDRMEFEDHYDTLSPNGVES